MAQQISALSWVALAAVVSGASCKVRVPVPAQQRHAAAPRPEPPPPPPKPPCQAVHEPRADLAAAKGVHPLVTADDHCVLMDDATVRCNQNNDGRAGHANPRLVFEDVATAAGLCAVTKAGKGLCRRGGCVVPEPSFDGADKLWALSTDSRLCPSFEGRIRCPENALSGSYDRAEARAAIEAEEGIVDIAANEKMVAVVKSDGSLKILADAGGMTPVPAPTDVEAVEPITNGMCALHKGGKVTCWEKLRPETDLKATSVAVPAMSSLGCHGTVCCGIEEDRGVRCWVHGEVGAKLRFEYEKKPMTLEATSLHMYMGGFLAVDLEGKAWRVWQGSHNLRADTPVKLGHVELNSTPAPRP